MKRRDFFKNTGMAGLAAGFSLCSDMVKSDAPLRPHLHKPARLKAGSTVALIAPASPFPPEKLDMARRNFATMGFDIREGKSLQARNGYLAGTDDERLEDLHRAFSDTSVDAVWCIRGGYGCTRILPRVDFDLIARNPKVLVGYSDITALHLAIQQKTGLVTFHGPVAAAELPENTLQHFRAALISPTPRYEISIPDEKERPAGDENIPFVVTPGVAKGPLTGGNLSLLAAMAGTPFSPSYRNRLVFIEDVGEQPYRIDRMLTQLLQATDLAQAAGIALGVFFDCKPKPNTPSLTLEETLRDRLAGLGIPVAYGLPFGHVAYQATLPYGIEAELNVEKGTLTLLESGVV